MVKQKQIKTTLAGASLSEFDALTKRLGLTPSATIKFAIRKLAIAELGQNQTASPGIVQKEAA
jgi:hypothetical protein